MTKNFHLPTHQLKGASTMGAATKETTDATFEADVLKSDKLVLVDFWAPWCGPCKAIAPIIDEIASANTDKLIVVKLNIDDNPATSAKCDITSIPTLNIYQDGEVVKTIVGVMPKPKLVKEIESFIN